MRRVIGVALAGPLVLAAAGLLAPGLVLACSGPVPTFEQATADARLIAAGEVVAIPHDGAYEVIVFEVFRGDVGDTVLIGSPVPSLNAMLCSHGMEIGDRVVVALKDETDLGLFSSGLWYLLPDGTVGTIANEPPAATHDELFARLRLLPDTATIQETSATLPLQLGGALSLGAAVVAAIRGVGRTRRRLRAERSP